MRRRWRKVNSRWRWNDTGGRRVSGSRGAGEQSGAAAVTRGQTCQRGPPCAGLRQPGSGGPAPNNRRRASRLRPKKQRQRRRPRQRRPCSPPRAEKCGTWGRAPNSGWRRRVCTVQYMVLFALWTVDPRGGCATVLEGREQQAFRLRGDALVPVDARIRTVPPLPSAPPPPR